MLEIITAMYEEGVLRPTRPLDLREHQRVRLQLLPAEWTDEAEEIIGLLLAAGLVRQPPTRAPKPPDPVSPEERRRIAEILGKAKGKSLSEIVPDDRGPR